MLRVFTRQIQKLHNEEGQALVFVAMVGMVIFLFVAMTMNLSELLNIKVKGQNVADATALSGAAWQARALNAIAGLNEIILYWWAQVMADAAGVFAGIFLVGTFCCRWTCMTNPICVSWLAIYAALLIWVIVKLFYAMQAGQLQEDVVNAFTQDLLQVDLPKIVDLNYEFKANTRSLANAFYMYTHQNAGNLWIDEGSSPRFVLERAGFCELMVGVFYHLCRRGYVLGCRPDWRLGWGGVLNGLGGVGLGGLYQPPSATPAGPCYHSRLPAGSFPYLFPYVLHTYNVNDWSPEDFEELLPVTVGVYRQREPPVVHLWGSDLFRHEMDCSTPPGDAKANWFPCTDQDHFSFATAHPRSEWVSDFYRSIAEYDSAHAEFSMPYPVPLAFGEMDWEERLFALEPRQEAGQVSPECGWQAYSDIATQVGTVLGPEAESYLRDNTLSAPAQPERAFFLY